MGQLTEVLYFLKRSSGAREPGHEQSRGAARPTTAACHYIKLLQPMQSWVEAEQKCGKAAGGGEKGEKPKGEVPHPGLQNRSCCLRQVWLAAALALL